jgi:hypothetical protein
MSKVNWRSTAVGTVAADDVRPPLFGQLIDWSITVQIVAWTVGLDGYQCYVGYGILSYNLHVLGRELQERVRRRADAEWAADRAAWLPH